MAKAQIKRARTSRGFMLGSFVDLGGQNCSIQESSRATSAAIWLGVDDANPVIMRSDAKKLGIETDATGGWVPYPIPQEVLLHTRMELNQEQAQALIVALQKFVDTGEL